MNNQETTITKETLARIVHPDLVEWAWERLTAKEPQGEQGTLDLIGDESKEGDVDIYWQNAGATQKTIDDAKAVGLYNRHAEYNVIRGALGVKNRLDQGRPPQGRHYDIICADYMKSNPDDWEFWLANAKYFNLTYQNFYRTGIKRPSACQLGGVMGYLVLSRGEPIERVKAFYDDFGQHGRGRIGRANIDELTDKKVNVAERLVSLYYTFKS